jgi:hypothetical protein
MTPNSGPRDTTLYALTATAAREAIEIVRKILSGRGFVLDYLEFPRLSWFDSGFPHLSSHNSDHIKRYRNAYESGVGDSKPVDFGSLPSFQALQEYCLTNEVIRGRLMHSQTPEPAREMLARVATHLFAERVMERFLHLHGDAEATDALLLPIYLPLEAPLVEDTLHFDVIVPVVLTHFPELENETISDDLCIRRLTDDEHRARWPRGTRTTESVNELVLSAATHAFVWRGCEVASEVWAQRYSNAVEGLPWNKIDLAFDALRIVAGVPTGYAQVVLDPQGWVDEYVGALPPLIHGPLVRRYPESFEDWGWIRPQKEVSRDRIADLTQTLVVLEKDPQLRMAARRFSASSLRNNEDDAVVDLCTSLEVLLTDDSKTEVLHKLSLRAAAIVHEFHSRVPAHAVFDAIRVVYDLRSMLLHGKKTKKNLRVLAWGCREAPTLAIARWITRTILRWTVARDGRVNPKEIDRELILDAITGRGAADQHER